MSDVDNNVIALMVLQEENKQLKDKLAKIEQIIDDCDLEAWEVLEKIKEVLKNE